MREARDSELTAVNAILVTSPDAVLVTDSQLQITHVNARTVDLLGYQEARLQGTPFLDLLNGRDHDRIWQLLEMLSAGSDPVPVSEQIEVSMSNSNGDEIIFDLHVARVTESGASCLVFTLRDITPRKQLEARLETRELMLSEAQWVAQIGIWRWDVESDRVVWSGELQQIFGVSEAEGELTYSRYLEFIHPEDRSRVHQVIQEALERRSSFEIEHRMLRPDGLVRLIYGRGTVNLDDAGNLASLTGTAQDVTDHKASEAQAFQLALEQAARQEAERTRERFQFLAEVSDVLGSTLELDQTLDSLMRLLIPRLADWCSMNTLDSSGMINRLAVEHRDPEKQWILESVRARDFLPHRDPSHPLTRAFRDGQGQLLSTVSEEHLSRMARTSDHLNLMRLLHPTSVMFVPLIARGRTFGVITFGMSDSGRRYSEEDLQLATEVAHRAAASIENANLYRAAQNAARGREEFVSLVSHELKTPLTVIKGYMQVLERYLEKPDWDRERILTTRQRLSTQVTRLELLVADILEVSRIQRGRLDLDLRENTDLAELARQVIERFDDAVERLPEHELRVNAAGPVAGRWDPFRLEQVFSNLISNALKYSPDGGRIDVSITSDGDQAVVEVSDQGIGITAEDRNNLFQPFQRGRTSGRSISGTGLGLYITRQIIEEHGGTISVSSSPGYSTTFTIRLPLEPDLPTRSDGHTG